MKKVLLFLLLAGWMLPGSAVAQPVRCDPEIDYVIIDGRLGGCDIVTIGLCCDDAFIECNGEICHGSWEVTCY